MDGNKFAKFFAPKPAPAPEQEKPAPANPNKFAQFFRSVPAAPKPAPPLRMSKAQAEARLREMNIDPDAVLDDFRGTPRRDSYGELIPTWRDRPAPFDPLAPKGAPKPTQKPKALWEEPEYRPNVAEMLDSDLDKGMRSLFGRNMFSVGGAPNMDPTKASIPEQQINSLNFHDPSSKPSSPSDRYLLKGEGFDKARAGINNVLGSDVVQDLTAPIGANENLRTIVAAPLNFGQGFGKALESTSNNVLGVGTDALNSALNLADPKREQIERPRTGLFDQNVLLDQGGFLNTDAAIIPQLAGQYYGGRMLFGKGKDLSDDAAKWAATSALVTPADAPNLADMVPKGTPLGDFVSPMQSTPGESTISGMMKHLGDSMLVDSLAAGILSGGDALYRAATAKPSVATNAGVQAPRARAPFPDMDPRFSQDIRSIMARDGAEAPEVFSPPPVSAAPQVAPTPPYPRPDLDAAQARPAAARAQAQPATQAEQRAQQLIDGVDSGGVPSNPILVNRIARDLGLDVADDAPMADTIERVRAALSQPSATPPYPRPDMDPVQPDPIPQDQPATATAPPAPVQPVGPPKAFSASPEPRGPGAWRRSAAGGFTGAFLGGVGDSWAASGGDGNGNGPDIINPINGGIAGMLVPRFAGQAWRAGRRASMRSPAARNAYDRKIAYDVLYKQFKAAGMPTAEAVVAAKEASYGGIEAAALLDMTQQGVNLASTLSRLPGTTPGRLAPRADELVENRPERLETYIGQVTELPTSAVRGNIEKLAEEAREAAKPAYEALRKDYPLGSINSQRLEQIEGLAPHIKAVDEYRLYVAANEGRVVGDFEYWDLVKRHMDSEEQQLLGRPGMTLDDIRVRKLESARAALVEEMDRLVPGYEAARELGGVAPKIKEAAAEGETYIGGRYLGDEVEAMISKWSGVPLTAAQSAAIRTIISKAKSGGAAVASLSSAKAREQLAGVFGKAKADDLQAFFAADAAIVRNASRTNPNVNSTTSQVMLGAGEGLLPAAAETIRAARNPVEAVLARMAESGAYSQAQRDIMGEMLAKSVTAENLAPIFAGRRPRGGGRPRGGAGPTTPQGPPTAGGAGPAAGAAAGPPPRAAAAAATQQPRPAPSQEAVLAAMAQVTKPGPGKARGPMGPPARETIWDGPIPTKPQSLRAWIRSQGGIDDTNYMTGDVAAMMGGSNRMPGLINRRDGTGLDELTRKAFQEGFDVDPEDASTLMRLIEEEFAGNPSYRIGAKDEWEAYQDTLRARRGEEPDQNSLGAFPGAGNAAAAASSVGGAAYGYYNPQDANEDGVIDDYDRQMTAMGMGFGGLVTAGLVRGAMGNRPKGPPGVQSNSFGGGSDKGPPAYNPRQEAANIRNSIGARAAPIIEKLPERAKGREMVEALAAEGVSMYKNEQKAFFRRFPQDKPATRKQVAAFMDDVASGKTFDGQLPAGRPVPPSVDEVTNLKAAQSLAAERPFGTNRELKVALDKRFRERAKAARVDLSEDTKATREYIARVALADAIEAIRTNANAIGWYDDKVTKAMSVMEEVHPELATDVNARFAFTVALAITSNGQKVGKNFELAEQAYQVFKNTGRMPTNISAGEAQKAINESLDLFNELLNKHGMDKLRDIITTKRTVKEINNLTGVKIDERIDEEVFGAGIFGPKIGNGFLMNLHGEFGQLTIDRWFMRTWGRWTGNLIEKNKEMMDTKRGHLSGLIEMMDPSDKREFEAIIGRRLSVSSIDDVAHAIRKASQDPALREQMAAIGGLGHNSRPMVDELLGPPPKGKERFSIGDELRKNGNGLWKYLDGQIEQPSGPPQRRQIREVLTTVLDALKKDYPDLTMADLQALLWYPEKRLYDGAKLADTVQVAEASTGKGAKKAAKEGYIDDEAPDYLNAAIEHAEKLGISRDKIDAAIRRGQTRIEARGRSGGLGSGNGRPAASAAAKTQASANQVPVAPLQGPPAKAKPPLPGQTSQSSPVIGSALASGGLTAGATYAATGDEDLALRAGLGAGIVGGVVGSRLSKGSTPKPPKGPPKSAPVKMGFGGSQQVEERGQMFYSALSRAVEKSPTTKAPASQWKATIANSPGVKAEEIEWTGINDWLDMQDGPVTKQQVAEYLDGNGVKIEETVKGAGRSSEAQAKYEAMQRELLPKIDRMNSLNNQLDKIHADLGLLEAVKPNAREQIAELSAKAKSTHAETKSLYGQINELRADMARIQRSGTAKWSSYTLPGGENYRELLLKMPPPETQYYSLLQKLAAKYDVDRSASLESWAPRLTPYERNSLERAKARYDQEGVGYKSSHWDEPNVLAHIRFKERTSADGKRVLAIEEIQSDWHQAGRDKGYRTGDVQARAAELKRRLDALDAQSEALSSQRDPRTNRMLDELGWHANRNEADKLRGEVHALSAKTVPDAPFKNNAWASLSLKRMIRWAAENDFDEIAWVPGQVPVERFNLSQALGDVTARQTPDGRVSFTPGNGSRAARQALQRFGEAGRDGDTIMTREQALEAFGKDAGSRMFDGASGQGKVFAGEDLNVGGEGMRAFYDKILVNEANKLGKKYGAQVGQTEIPTGEDPGARRDLRDRKTPFHSLRITPELKKQALGGQALMSLGGRTGRGIADNLKQDAALVVGANVLDASDGDQDEGLPLAAGLLGAKYGGRAVNAMRGAGRVKPPPVRGAAQGKFRGPSQQTFAGVNAKTADKVALARAQNMEAEGAGRDAIWDETGWFKGVDGKWRFEIDDTAFQRNKGGFEVDGSGSAPLGAIFGDADAGGAYPSLAKIKTQMDDTGFGAGYTDPKLLQKEKIRIGSPGLDEDYYAGQRGMALHERQHAIQHREDFARGGSPSRLSDEWKAPDLEAQISKVAARIKDVEYQLGNTRRTNWQPPKPLTPQQEQALTQELDALMYQHAQLRSGMEMELYRRLAGEVEARNVETRMNMTPEQRRAKPPWQTEDRPVDQQIVRFGSGKAESRPKPPSLDDSAGVGQSGGMLSEELKRAKTQRMALRQRLSQIFEDLGEDVEVAKAASPRDLQRLAEDIRYDLNEESYQELRNEIQNLDDIETGIQDILHSRRHEQRMRSALRGKGADDLAALTRMASGAEPLQEGVTDLTASQIRRSAQAGFGPSKQQKGPPKAR